MIPCVKDYMELFDSIGERLREVREGMGLSQSAFAEFAESAGAAGTTRQSQSLYEKGKRMPDAAYLSAIAARGADVLYIITGVRSAQALSRDEQELISAYRAAPLVLKAAAIGVLTTGAAAPDKKQKQVIKGPANQVAGRDVVNHREVHLEVQEKTKPKNNRER